MTPSGSRQIRVFGGGVLFREDTRTPHRRKSLKVIGFGHFLSGIGLAVTRGGRFEMLAHPINYAKVASIGAIAALWAVLVVGGLIQLVN
jgi:hypothetical protein